MIVSTHTLREVSNKILSRLEETGNFDITIDSDYYWSVPAAEKYDVLNTPTDLTVGQLTDDLHELLRIQSGDGEPVSYGLVWLAEVMHAIGVKIVA